MKRVRMETWLLKMELNKNTFLLILFSILYVYLLVFFGWFKYFIYYVHVLVTEVITPI